LFSSPTQPTTVVLNVTGLYNHLETIHRDPPG